MDAPLTYEVDWGKMLSYVFAFSKNEVVDGAERYTKDWEVMLSQCDYVDEEWLKYAIDKLNHQKMSGLSDARVVELKECRASEQRVMNDAKKSVRRCWRTSFWLHRMEACEKRRWSKVVCICRVMTLGCDNVTCVNPHGFRKRKSDGLNAMDPIAHTF